MGNLELYEKVRSVPKEAQKTIQAGRLKGFTDINPMWRIKRLTEQFGICGIGWYYEVTNQWIENAGDEKVACVNINLYIKVDGEWSKPIFGTGGSKLVQTEKGGLYVSDECFKMATTDAISVACKNLGMGADVYWDGDRTKYTPVTKEQKEEAKAEAKYEQVGNEKIDDIKVRALTKRCEDEGVPLDYILKAYKIEKLEDMTIKQFSQVVNNWKVVLEKSKK